MTNKPNELPSLPDRAQEIRAIKGAAAFFDKGRCSGHEQFNGRYCRDVAEPEQWCIHCAGFVLLDQLRAAQEQIRELNEAHRGSVTLMKRVVERAETAEAALQARVSSGNEKEKD